MERRLRSRGLLCSSAIEQRESSIEALREGDYERLRDRERIERPTRTLEEESEAMTEREIGQMRAKQSERQGE